MDQQQETFDVFLSYADADRAWVETSLIPQLRAAEVVICTERETFDIGVPQLINRERAVEQSRHTLIVLSPAWLASEWTAFEALLTQTTDPAAHARKLLPLLLEPCQLPRRIAMLHAADLTNPSQRTVQIQRVIAAIHGQLQLAAVRAPLSVLLGPEGRNRSAMLRKVRTIWIDGLLKHSLYHETLIALGLHERPDAVARPLDVLVQRPNHPNTRLPPDTRIIDVFDTCDGALLILGAPGAGKTTLLLDLTRDLLDRAEQDVNHPIPVVFPLSSWAERRLPLVEWLVDELNKRYDVPRMLAQSWVAADTILPLLDGVDEVKADVRRACAEAINTYRQAHGLLPIVVSSRIADYETLTVKLRLHGAIVVQPLTREQVKAYLWQIGLRVAPSTTSPLWDLLDTPLMLSIATLTYAGDSHQVLPTANTSEAQRDQLFTAYVTRMFERRPASHSFPHERTCHWLAWLAWQMQQHQQTVLYLEHLQPDWLPTRRMRWQYVLVDRLGLGLVGALAGALVVALGLGLLVGLVIGLGLGLGAALFGGVVQSSSKQQDIVQRMWSTLLSGLVGALVGALVVGLGAALDAALAGGLSAALDAALAGGLGGGLMGGLFGALAGTLVGRPHIQPRWITTVEVVRWSWQRAWRSMLTGLVGALVVGLGTALTGRLVVGLIVGLDAALVVGLGAALGAALTGGFTSSSMKQKVGPNQGIRRSGRNALVVGLVVGLGVGLGLGLVVELGVGLGLGLGAALVAALVNGGYACLSHAALRLVLWYHRTMPLAYVRFLDENAQRILLRKVGGGYIFIHRMLLDYFAAQYKGSETTEVDATSDRK
jgi:MFS family permease/DNA polymerase III delta prime subunit